MTLDAYKIPLQPTPSHIQAVVKQQQVNLDYPHNDDALVASRKC